jgi:very-short-patch-repair endonuclease
VKRSGLELLLEGHMISAGVARWKSEYRFHPVRMWRFDFAWPENMVAVELEGGLYTSGRHTSIAGFTEDCEKYNEATLLGWRVLRFTGEQVRDGTALKYVEMALR